MRPPWVIVGEVRGDECLDRLLALNSGLPGMASLHAAGALEALVRMCTLPLLAGESYPIRKWVLWVGECTLPVFGSQRSVGALSVRLR